MKLAVLGAGKMGRAIAFDFCRQKDVKQVTLLEQNPKVLEDAVAFIKNPKLKAVRANLSSPSKIPLTSLIWAETTRLLKPSGN